MSQNALCFPPQAQLAELQRAQDSALGLTASTAYLHGFTGCYDSFEFDSAALDGGAAAGACKLLRALLLVMFLVPQVCQPHRHPHPRLPALIA